MGKTMKKMMALVIAMVMTLALGITAFAATSDASATYPIKVEVRGIEDGNTLTLYKIVQFNLDSATNAFDYTLATGLPAAYDTIDELAALTPDSYTLADDTTIKTAADILANGIAEGTIIPVAMVTATASGKKVTIEECPAGWYVAVVTGTADTSIIYQNMIIDAMPEVDSENNTYKSNSVNAVFEVKHSDEEVEKTVGSEKAASTDKYSVGDVVPFEITTTIPNYPTPSKVATFKITDTPSDLTDIIDATGDNKMTVTINGTEVARSASLQDDGATYTVTKSGDGFVIEFAKAYILAHPGQAVVVNYSATIKESAQIEDDGLTANNTAKITFNPNPNDSGIVEPGDTTQLYTYGVTVLKHEDGNEAKTLKGAKFILYAEDGETVVREETEVDANGKLTWDGLEAGSYKLVETVAPAGYRLDSTPKDVTLSNTTATGDDPLKDGDQTYVLESKVPNTPGSTLPSTGGMGTTIFYVIGGILVLAAAIILISRRKVQQ